MLVNGEGAKERETFGNRVHLLLASCTVYQRDFTMPYLALSGLLLSLQTQAAHRGWRETVQ